MWYAYRLWRKTIYNCIREHGHEDLDLWGLPRHPRRDRESRVFFGTRREAYVSNCFSKTTIARYG